MSVCITPTTYANCGTFAGAGIYTFPNPPCTGYGLTLPMIPGNLGLQTYTYTYPNLILTNTAVVGGTLACTVLSTATTIVIPAITLSTAINPTNGCLTPGQSATITALSNYSTTTYTWVPGNLTGSQVVVSPTANTVYTITADNGTCSIIGTVAVNVPPLPQFTNTPLTLCTGQYIYYLENWLAPGTPTGGVWTVPFITSPTGTSGLTAGYLNPTITPIGTQTISYTYTTNTGCTPSNSFTVNIVPGFVLNTNGMSTYCSNLGVGALLDANATPSANISFTWIPGNLVGATQTVAPGSPTTYTVIATNTVNGCQFDATTFVDVRNDCCAGANYISVGVLSNTFITGQWAVNQNVSISGSVTIQGEFLIAPNVSITVTPGSTLSTGRQGAHLYSCGNMWQGIDVQNGGHVYFTGYDVIEDAVQAFRSIGSTNTSTTTPTIWLLNTTVNRCQYGVYIKSYNQLTNTSPFVFTNCVFTCRNLNITPGSLNYTQWNNATAPTLLTSNGSNGLASPYPVGGYTPVNLKAPNNARPTFAGVYIENSGASFGVTNPSPVYYTVLVGDLNQNASPMLFDNLMYGIYSLNSNFISRGNIFQNTRRFLVPPKSYIGGAGIYAVNDLTNTVNPNSYLRTVDPQIPGTNINHFYDCHFGMYAYNIHEINAQFDDYRSTQISPGANSPLLPGQFGIYMVSNKFKNYQIRNNRLQNVNTGIYVAAYPSAMNMPPFPNFGAYMDRIYITSNFISPALSPTAAIGTGVIGDAVVAVSNISGFSGANTFYTPGAQLAIMTNTMDRVWRGSYVSNFSNKNFTAYTANNKISIVQVANPIAAQHAIEHLANTADVVNTNTIVGTVGTFNYANAVGVYRSMNSSGSTQCNSVTSVYAGFEFAGNNSGAFWRNNIMNTNRRGLQLTNAAILSQQGSFNNPSDNLWQGIWGGGNLNTYCAFGVNPSNSGLAVRTVPVGSFNPVFNGGFAPNIYPLAPGSILFANNNAPFAACLPQGGGCNNCNPNFVASLNDIASGSITYTGNVAQTDEINQNLVFRDVVMEPTLTVASSTLSNFYSANTGATRGQYSNIEDNLRQGNTNLASALISALSPTSNIENNYQLFYNIYNNYLTNGSISVSDNIALLILSYQCPFTDGAVVYDARNLYSVLNETVINYNDKYCTELGFAFKPMQNDSSGTQAISPEEMMLYNTLQSSEKQNTDKFAQFVAYNLFPNPAQTDVSIISTRQSEKLAINITDVEGRLLWSGYAVTQGGRSSLKLDLINGIYFVNLINEQGLKTVKKLVISK